jgi:hypothetical protein
MSKLHRYVMGVCLSLASSVMAECLDVYGVDKEEAALLMKQYRPQLLHVTRKLYAGLEADFNKFFDSSEALQWRDERQALMDKIKREHGYAYTQLETIFYGKKEYCTTLEIVPLSQKQRLHYLPVTQTHHADVSRHDVIDEMRKYLTLGEKLFLTHEIEATHASCPVYHCTMGFEHPQLKPYLKTFNLAAQNERPLILRTLKSDPNPNRRALAAYFVGHFKDPNDIVNTLLPYVNDPDEAVRNNVIRVLSLTTHKANITHLDPTVFVQLLDSPCPTDRNKSLFLLSVLSQSEATQQYLIAHGKAPLLNILRLQQPNQHDFAYQILKAISHEDFGPHDERRWAIWFDQKNNQRDKT